MVNCTWTLLNISGQRKQRSVMHRLEMEYSESFLNGVKRFAHLILLNHIYVISDSVI